jgi:hypothetical protein
VSVPATPAPVEAPAAAPAAVLPEPFPSTPAKDGKGKGKGKKNRGTTVDPSELQWLFKGIWKRHATLEKLSATLKQSTADQQEALALAYSLVGGTVLQAEDGRTFRIRPIGPTRMYVFIWEPRPTNVIKI